MSDHGQIIYTASVFLFVLSEVLCIEYAVTSLSDWTPNGEFFGVCKSSVNPKDPPNISPHPEYKPNKNANGPL